MKGDFNAWHSCISPTNILYFSFQMTVTKWTISYCPPALRYVLWKRVCWGVMSFPKELVTMNLGTKTRTTCLTDKRSPVCGDGMVEGREECDCGTVFLCTATRSSEQWILAQYREWLIFPSRSCCVPPGGMGHLVPCSFRSDIANCTFIWYS